MAALLRAGSWLAVYLAVAVVPLVFAAIGVAGADRGLATEFSTALGFVGLAMLGLEFALVARFDAVAAPFGANALVQFHRNMGLVGLGFVLTHVAISASWDTVFSLFDPATPWRVRFGVLAALALVALAATSIWRTRLRLSYEAWHRLHIVLAVVVVLAAVTHVLLVDYYLDSAWKQVLWGVMFAGFLALLVWTRVVLPWRLRRRPWEITEVTSRRGDSTSLTLQPVGHRGMDFAPGQFAWFAIGHSPYSVTKHPFSISSSAERSDGIEVTIKALGDFTSTVATLERGTPVYVDGPYGVFTPDRNQGAGFCFVAGGVGVTPIVSALRTLADRGDPRPVLAVVANVGEDDIVFRDELDELGQRLDLTVVHTLEDPAPEWSGEQGFVDAELLRRHLPERIEHWQFFVCGPDPMMDAVTDALLELGVGAERVHSERFGWI